MADQLIRTVVWKSLLIDGADYCSLWRTTEGWMLKGTVVGGLKDKNPKAKNEEPMLVQYEIHCDENWLTHRVEVQRSIGSDTKSLSLSVESRGVWRSSNKELPAVQDCADVDLSITPATNTLPIRRLNLQVGTGESVISAWVKFPDLTVEPLSQRYTRINTNTYRYQSNTGFSADLVVDDLGLVISYPGGWERLATE
jgi:uncharacterized protein